MTAHSFFVSVRPGLPERCSSNATESSEIDAGFGGSPTEVRQFWLWRLKPTVGDKASAQRLQDLPLRASAAAARRG